MNDPDILNFGNTPLMKVAARGTAAELRRLLSKKLDVNQTNDNGQTALLYAAYYNLEPDVVALLLAAGSKVDHKDRHNAAALNYAALAGNVEAVRALIQAGANVDNRAGHFRTTPLIDAATYGHVEVVKELLVAGADPKIESDYSHSAMDIARAKNQAEIIDLLLDFWPRKNS